MGPQSAILAARVRTSEAHRPTDCPRNWAGELSSAGSAAGADPILRFPGHGRHGADHARAVLARLLAAVSGSTRDDALVSVGNLARLPPRLYRDPQRLVYRRGRAPAMDRVRNAAHHGRGTPSLTTVDVVVSLLS